MPIPPMVAAAGAAAGGNILGQGLSLWSNNRQNRLSRDFSREMYQTQKTDNIDFWNMQNAYNDPAMQMERLRSAGLNPAMIYGGQGSGAAGQSGPLHTPSAMAAKFNPTDFKQLGRTVVDAQQAGLMVKQGQMMDSQIIKNIEEAQAIGTRQEGQEFDNYMDRKLEGISTDLKRESVRNLQARTHSTLSENERRQAMHAKNMTMAYEKIIQIRLQNTEITPIRKRQIEQQIKQLRQDTNLKYYENQLRKKGMTFNDPRYWRMISTAVDKAFNSKQSRDNLGRILESGMKELLEESSNYQNLYKK